jgi:hydrogenase assembly chaperone HypC/HupF
VLPEAMCVAEPALVLAVEAETARVDVRGHVRRVPLIVVTSGGESVGPGDWLLVQTGLAVAKITEAEARDRIDFQTRGASHGAT